MKFKQLKVLLPTLTGMLLTGGNIKPVNNFEQVSDSRKINFEKNSYRKNQGFLNDDCGDYVYFQYEEEIMVSNVYVEDFLRFYRRSDDPSILYFKLCTSSCYKYIDREIHPTLIEYSQEKEEFYLSDCLDWEHISRDYFKVSDFYEKDLIYFTHTCFIEREDLDYEILSFETKEDGFTYLNFRLFLKDSFRNNYSPEFKNGYVDLQCPGVNSENVINKDELNSCYIEEEIFDFLNHSSLKYSGYRPRIVIMPGSLASVVLDFSLKGYIPTSIGEYYNLNDLKKNFYISDLEISNDYPEISNEDVFCEYNKIFFDESFDIRKFLSLYLINKEEESFFWLDHVTYRNTLFPKYIIGNISEFKIFNYNQNNKSPSILYVDFNLFNLEEDCFEPNRRIYFLNTFISENINFFYSNKEINQNEIIDIGYSKSNKDLYNIFSNNFENDLDLNEYYLILDGKILDKNDKSSLYKILKNNNGYSELEYVISSSNNINNGEFFEFKNEGYDYFKKTYYIKWVDDISPEVKGEVLKYRTANKDNFKFKELFKANDEKDGDVSESIELIDEEGKYYIKAKDSSGNETKQEIVLDIDNILYENINVINDVTLEVPENILLTKNRFEKILKKIYEVDPEDVNMLEYINNSRTKGIYKVSFKVNDEEKEMDFNVVDPIEKKVEPEDVADQINEIKDNFIEKVKLFFEKIGNWFKGVFTKFKFDCFISDEDWDTRFN